jgi:hypothetical protein
MDVFTVGLAYDSAVNTVLVFATISYAEPPVKAFSTTG